MKRDSLGDRMKTYEKVNRTYLTRRMPAIIRLDGKAFHSFTRNFCKPFDDVLVRTMQQTMKYLCENIQGCVFGYTQSDEISLVLVDYQNLDSSAWFDYNVQKMASISASMATLAFNRFFNLQILVLEEALTDNDTISDANLDYLEVLKRAADKGAFFDARVFNIPKEEVTNCILWRQNDATRNSIESVGQAHFSQKQLNKKTCNMIQDMLFTEYNINWNDLPAYLKRGSACLKRLEENGHRKWFIDLEMPILKGDGREYLDSLVYI